MAVVVFSDLYPILSNVLVQRPLVSSLAVIALTFCARSAFTAFRAYQVCRLDGRSVGCAD